MTSRSGSRDRSRGRQWEPSRSRSKGKAENEAPSNNKGDSLYICNLSSLTTNEELEELLHTVGKVESVDIVKNPYTKESRGFAFVSFVDPKDAETAIEKFQNYELRGKRLRVEMSKRNRPYPKSPGRYLGSHPVRPRSRSKSRDKERRRDSRRDRSRSRSRSRNNHRDRRRKTHRSSRSRSRSGSHRRRRR
eukprot:TRINITY_DN3212_c0_g1_i6.p1 TRINITY_DN3212_c0_g1~~TRINITY_DN3212_c0_g1_i6.p1  ORF type:complete len:191 (-),score=25.92 TRINITY_DN3212_c0_g1_i6:109-681(-)